MSILDKYGIKEVCDVTFYTLDSQGKPDVPVLYLDTLKVSGIEQTAEQTEARGGMGNPVLLIWDFGKEINVNMEDALFSMKSLEIAYGGTAVEGTLANSKITIKRTIPLAGLDAAPEFITLPDKKKYAITNSKYFPSDVAGGDSAFNSAVHEFLVTDIVVKGNQLNLGAKSFADTYYVVGDTFARNSVTGKDEPFQLVFPKAKMLNEQTFELSADGDPAVFNFAMRLMRPADEIMMKLIKYELGS